MDKFEKMIFELMNSEKETEQKEVGEERKIIVSYHAGNEEDARIENDSTDKKVSLGDSMALMFAAGNTISAHTGIDKKVMSNAIFGAAIDTLMKHMIDLVKDVLM